jgi:ComF family protein
MARRLSTLLTLRKLTKKMDFFQGLLKYKFYCCLLCGGNKNLISSVCLDCNKDLPKMAGACKVCARPLAHTGICGLCINTKPSIDGTVSAFHYAYPVDLLIKNIKYKQELRAIFALTSVLADRVMAGPTRSPDILLPVPLHASRHFRRGFNQSLEICKVLSLRLGVPYDVRLVRRTRSTQPMSLLTPAERAANVRGAFSISSPIKHKKLALVDDVVTSGSTTQEIARILKKSGAEQVVLWTLARA